jgi:hypothetical protein
MPKRKKIQKAPKKAPAPQIAPLQRGLPMPQYDYQNPRTGSFVTRYDEVEDRKKSGAQLPALQNFQLVVS